MTEPSNYSGSSQDRSVGKPQSPMAMISLIAGILGLTAIPVLGSILAILTSSMATNEIAESDGELGGEGMAQAGKILGWIGISLTFLGICLVGVIFVSSLCLVSIGIREAWSALIPLALTFL